MARHRHSSDVVEQKGRHVDGEGHGDGGGVGDNLFEKFLSFFFLERESERRESKEKGEEKVELQPLFSLSPLFPSSFLPPATKADEERQDQRENEA